MIKWLLVLRLTKGFNPWLKNYLLDAGYYLVFIIQSYFSVPKEVRWNSTHYLIIKIHKKKELQQTAINHLADYKDFMEIYKKCTSEPYSFLIIDTTLQANDPLRFWKNLIDPLKKWY